MPPRRQHLSGGRLRKTAGNKFKCPGCPHTFDSHTEVNNHVKEIHKTTLLGLTYQQDSKRAENLLFKVDSHKEDSCREIDRLINELSRAEENLTQTILNEKVLAEKEKVTATIEK
ncbi:19119_t:CDS:2 [Racocetra fulgida]|uniref:19119_t:CDS:1 n=1 Tax=Racocetra fulgida TaxID=60492 RepID=A0A9N9AXQ2_9GLOM|nr:19119_t:CDS:2 [Racocetra fulgida]